MSCSGFQPISLEKPTPEDEELSDKLMEKVRSVGGFDSEETKESKGAVLLKLDQIAKEFTELLSSAMSSTEQVSGECHIKILTSGLHGLGVPTNKPDIDVLFVGSRLVSRLRFFSLFYIMLRRKEGVKDTNAAPDAFVPVIRATVDNVEVDIVFAGFPSKDIIPGTLELRDDNILKGLDMESVRSLNWCRVNAEILHLVPEVDNFRNTLRAILVWAKRRGIYSSCLGFLGGMSYAILVAKICQLYPHALPSDLIKAFFQLFSKWKWSWQCPVLLKPSTENWEFGDLAWDPRDNPKDRAHVMPIVYPIHPHINSTFNVTESSLQIMKKEFNEGFKVVSEVHNNEACWSKIFEEFKFFDEFQHFMVVTASAADDGRFRRWVGMVQSKIQNLVNFLEPRNCISSIRVNTEHFSPVSETNKYVRRWFVGLVSQRPLRAKDLRSPIDKFKSMTVLQARRVGFYTEDMKLEAAYVDRHQVEDMRKENSHFGPPTLSNTAAVGTGEQPSTSSVAEKTCQYDETTLPIPPKVRKTE